MSNATAVLTVEPKRLFEALKFAFTNTSSVLTELMQNARRAGATEVRFITAQNGDGLELSVSDDGVGIEDLSVLLKMAESAWNEDVLTEESPYGLGFLSCLYATTQLSVRSNGKQFVSGTKNILDLEEIDIVDDMDPPSGWGSTCITLRGVKLEEREIVAVLETNATGFPISVMFNGRQLQRPHADSGGRGFTNTAVGKMSVRGMDTDIGRTPVANLDAHRCAVYLQGMPIKLTHHGYAYGANMDVLHLDPKQFGARWPDRDTLHNVGEVKRKIGAVYAERIYTFLLQQRSRMGIQAFIECYAKTHFQSAPDLFTDNVPFVHKAFLCGAEYPKQLPSWWGETINNDGVRDVSREELESGETLIVDLNDGYDPEMNALAWMAVYGSKRCFGVPDMDRLPKWAKKYLVTDADFNAEIVGSQSKSSFTTEWIVADVVFCEEWKIILSRTGEALATFKDDAVYLMMNEDPFIAAPNGETSGEVVRQVSAFVDDGDYMEIECDENAAAFSRLLMTERGQPTTVLQEILRDSQAQDLEKLRGKKFQVIIDDTGCIEVSLVEEPT